MVRRIEIRKAAREDWAVALSDLIVYTHVYVEVRFISQFGSTISVLNLTCTVFNP